MKEFKGTPGPWRVSEKRGDMIDIRHSDNGIGAISLNLAHVVARQSWLKEAEANAKLIAASPSLLSSLQHLVEVYDSEDGKQWTTTSKKAAIAEARAAIDKALG